MDHNMNMPGMSGMDHGSGSMMMMRMTFTTAIGVPLWFDEWTPSTVGSTFGACLGLFCLAVLSRFIAAISCSAERAWDQHLAMQRTSRALSSISHQQSADSALSTPKSEQSQLPTAESASEATTIQQMTMIGSAKRYIKDVPSFVPAIDIVRGVVFAFYGFILYLLMLAVMTYSVWYLIAILLGSGLGETLFGRWSKGSHDDGIHL